MLATTHWPSGRRKHAGARFVCRLLVRLREDRTRDAEGRAVALRVVSDVTAHLHDTVLSPVRFYAA